MKSQWIAVMFAFLAFLVSAPAGAQVPAAKSYYDFGNLVYRYAGMPGPSRLLGWYSGRCATVTKPSVKIAALLTTYVSGGKLKSVFWIEPKKPEDYFDRLTPEMIREIESGLQQYDPDIPFLNPRVDHWEAIHLGTHKDSTKTRATARRIAVRAFRDDVQTRVCLFETKVYK